MGDAGDELTYSRKPFAVQQLFLCLAQVFIRLTRLFVKDKAIDRAGNLASNGNQQVYVGRRKLARRASTHDEPANHAVLGPENYNVRGGNSFFDLGVAKNSGKQQTLRGNESGVGILDVLQQLRFHGDRGKIPGIFGTVACGGNAAQLRAAFIKKVERSGVQAKELGYLLQSAVQGIVEVQGLRQSLADGIQHHQFAVTLADFQL